MVGRYGTHTWNQPYPASKMYMYMYLPGLFFRDTGEREEKSTVHVEHVKMTMAPGARCPERKEKLKHVKDAVCT